MIYVALVQAVALVALVSLWGDMARRTARTHERRVDLLLDRLAHAEGRSWQPAPAEVRPPPVERERYDRSPEQDPEL